MQTADMAQTQILSCIFGDVDLQGAMNLHSVDHCTPSTIGIDTIYRSAGEIPEVFLRGAGAPDNFVTFIRSLTGNAVEFYSCFISYFEFGPVGR